MKYTEGSSISGFYFDDEGQLGDALQKNPPFTARLGCHLNENNLFYTQQANGILGLAPRGNTFLKQLFGDKSHVSSSTFAFCLAEWGGRFVIGGYNSSYHISRISYISMDVTGGYYGIQMSAMRVGGRTLNVRLGEGILDSGTTYTYIHSSAYRALRNAIEDYCKERSSCGATKRDKCWKLAAGDPNAPGAGLARFPAVDVGFRDVWVPWTPAGYLFRKGSGNTWCYSFEDDGPHAKITLGASFMMHKEVIFDLTARRIGIATANCPEFRKRPLHDDLPPLDTHGRFWFYVAAIAGLGLCAVVMKPLLSFWCRDDDDIAIAGLQEVRLPRAVLGSFAAGDKRTVAVEELPRHSTVRNPEAGGDEGEDLLDAPRHRGPAAQGRFSSDVRQSPRHVEE